MMESMRNAAKGWVAKVLIGLLAVSFGVWGIADVFTNFGSSALATVGKAEISGQDFSRAFNQYMQNVSRQTGQPMTPEDARKLGIDRAVLNNLIQSAAIDNQAINMKLAVSDRMLALETMQNQAFLGLDGKFDADLFKRLLANNGLNEAAYFADERRSRLREALTGSADGNVTANPSLVEALFRHRNDQRDARYFVATTAETDVSAPTEEEIKAEYDANPAPYTAPEYRAIAIMRAEPADLAAKIELSDGDIAAGYDKYKADYLTPEKRTILQIAFPSLEDAQAAKDRIAGGTDFLAIAKERGFAEADITFADKSRNDFVDPAIAEAAFRLAEGAVSDPVKGALATVLLKAVKILPEHQATLDEVKAELGNRLKLEQAREELQSIYDAIEDARAASGKFEDIAAQKSIPFQIVAATDAEGKDKSGAVVDLPHKAELLKAAFSSDVGIENDAITLDDGYVWYEVREVMPSAVKPFDSVKAQAAAQVTADKLRAKSEEKAKAMVERLKGGALLEELAKDAGAEVKSVQGLKRNESGQNFDAAAVAALFAVPETGFAYSIEPGGRSAMVMQSQAVLLQAFDAASPEAKSIAGELAGQIGNEVLSGYLTALQKEIGVSINETLWRQISGAQTQ
jgi:peptidyl-prolyl cis-trans isomerase D